MRTATFASGCFWCTEAIFKRLKGVTSVVSGYAGGTSKNPDYYNMENHAEGIQVTFDESIISFEKLVEIFFHLHDPTTINRQGNDIGTEYRSILFFHNDTQKKIAEKVKEQIEKDHLYNDPIVTKIQPFEAFYKAEDYHQNYYEKNKDYPYCRYVINPKLQKLLKEFKQEVKEEYLTGE